MNLLFKLELGFVVTLVVIILFGWIIFPAVIKSQIKSQSALKKGGEARELWEKLPFPLEFKIFLFNVTNYRDVHRGSTPILQEIGPYYYEEWLEKTEVMDHEENDSVSYYIKRTYQFIPEKSAGLTGNEIVVLPHPLIMVAAFTILRTPQASMISTFNKVVDVLFDKPETGFIITEARKLLFDGIPIYCNVTEIKTKAVCKKLKKEAKDLGRFSEDVLKLSLFHSKNGTTSYGRFKSKRGIKKGEDLGRIIEYDNVTKMNIWSGEECNQIYGTDATIFPTGLNSDQEIRTFSPEICRSTKAYFEKKITYKGISVNRYTATLGDMSANENEKCFCPEKCLKKGAMDLMKCINTSIVITLPHFYDTDESYARGVHGLSPDQHKHEIFLNFEHMSGLPLLSAKRLQFNLPIEPIEKMPLLKNLPTCLLPMFWIEESLELNSTFINRLKNELFLPMKVISALKWTILIVCIVGILVSIGFHLKGNGRPRSTNRYETEKYHSRTMEDNVD